MTHELEELWYRLARRFLDYAECIVGVNCMASRVPDRGLAMSTNSADSTFQGGLVNGGPSTLLYGVLLSWLGSLAVCASLAEMSSMHVNESYTVGFGC